MSGGWHRQRSESGRRQDFPSEDGYTHSHGYGQARRHGFVEGGGGGGYEHPQDFAPTQGSYNHVYAYDMYAQRGHDTRTTQNWGYDNHENFSGNSTYGNDYTYNYPGDGSGYDGYSNFENHSNYGNVNDGYAESSYSYHPMHQPPRQGYTTLREDRYYNYGRRSGYSIGSHGHYSSHRSYSSYSSQRPTQSHPPPQSQESITQRRQSPVYDDYTHDTGSTSHSIPSTSPSPHFTPRSHTNRKPPSPLSSDTHVIAPSFFQSRTSLKEKRTKPTDEYLAISSEASHTLVKDAVGKEDEDVRKQARKLIVLDLNGTLVLRGQHRRAAFDHVSPTRSGLPPGPSFQVRTVYPRPYLSTFIEYILHDETKKWLDAMVWSSAQPRSVDDMVGRSFGERRAELRAVWARNTLGLSIEDYHKKSITLKDLEKPWAELPFTLELETSSSLHSPSSSSSPVPPPTSPIQETGPQTPSRSRASSPAPLPPSSQITCAPSSPPPPQNTQENQERELERKEYHHSALSTLLIDDSPVKASLQPWNHLCIREYVAHMRKDDLEILLDEEGRGERDGEREGQQSPDQGGDEGVSTKKKKKEGKKERHRVRDARLKWEAMEREAEKPDIGGENVGVGSSMVETQALGGEDEPFAATTSLVSTVAHDYGETMTSTATTLPRATHEEGTNSPIGARTGSKEHKEYDQTLLAVIGVLDTIRHESNVAGWMRAGGLMRVGYGGTDIHAAVGDTSNDPIAANATSTGEVSTASATGGGPSIVIETEIENGKEKRKTKLVHTPPTRSREASPFLPSTDSKKRRRIGDVGPVVEVEIPVGMGTEMDTRLDDTQSQQKEVKEDEREAQEMTGVPLESSPPTPKHSHHSSDAVVVDAALGGSRVEDEKKPEPEKPKLWFEHPEIFAHWVARGKKALRELDIAVVAGVRR